MTTQQDQGDRQDVAAAGTRQRRVVQAGSHREQPPDEEDALDREQRPDHVGVDQLGDQPRAGCRGRDPQRDDEGHDHRRQEQGGETAPPGDEVAEPRDQRVEDGRDIARMAA